MLEDLRMSIWSYDNKGNIAIEIKFCFLIIEINICHFNKKSTVATLQRRFSGMMNNDLVEKSTL